MLRLNRLGVVRLARRMIFCRVIVISSLLLLFVTRLVTLGRRRIILVGLTVGRVNRLLFGRVFVDSRRMMRLVNVM